jgi:proteasome accessory factor A
MNTRDEPHADPAKYRRLHVIVGDANMAELSTYLKVGTMALVLELIEAGWPLPVFELDDPVRAIKQVSRDLDVKQTLKLIDGRPTTAIAVQQAYLRAVTDYAASHLLSPAYQQVLSRWGDVLDKLEREPMALARELDWVAKRQMIESYMDRKGCGWNDPRVLLLDLQYHDVRPEKGLYYALERTNRIERIVTDAAISRAEHQPPTRTRAYFRGTCLKKFASSIYGGSWTSVLFDVGNTSVKKVPLLEPTRGTEALTRELLEGCETAAQLLSKLTA